MARRKGKRRGGRKNKAIPISGMIPLLPAVGTAWKYKDSGLLVASQQGIYTLTGVDIMGVAPFNMDKAVQTGTLAVIGIVGHKVASKVGINRTLKRLTGGWVQF